MAARTRAAALEAEVTDEDLLPEARPEELPPETGTAVPKPIPVRYTVVREGEEGTLEVALANGQVASVPYRAGDLIVRQGDVSGVLSATDFNRHYRVVQGEDSESAYDEQYPKFTTGGTGYVRVVCPDCEQSMIFSVSIGEIRTSGDKSTLKPTFKVTAKEHVCHQVSAKLEDHEDEPVIASPEDADDAEDDGDE